MTTVTDLQTNLATYKYNPVGIQRAILEHLDNITDGKVNIVDATSPFMFLLDASCVNTATSIQEYQVNLRKQYPSLSQTEMDLYGHMSDVDYLDRFAKPSTVLFTIALSVADVTTKLVSNPDGNCYQATIPRDTYFTVDEYTFTLEYPIDIKRFSNGVYQFSFDGSVVSPLGSLTNNIIDYVVRRDSSGVDWVFFKVPVKQFKINTSYQVLRNAVLFEEGIGYADQFYYARVFCINNDNSTWVELLTTHSDQIYDPLKPTALLSVVTGHVTVSIPMIYSTSNLLRGNIRIDVYTTKGPINVNMSNYAVKSFSYKLLAINAERDSSIYTAAMSDMNLLAFSDQFTYGGGNQISFNDLRDRVINNSMGDRQLPITNVQLTNYIENRGFELVRNVDVITNRVFLAIRKLPNPTNLRLLTPANIGISTVTMDLSFAKTLEKASDNGTRVTLHSNNLFINENGIVRVVTAAEQFNLQNISKTALADTVNSRQYIYNPYYYVLDNNDKEFDSRAYHLDQPTASNLSFIYQNETMLLPVNTGTFTIVKTATGFKLTISSKSGNVYKGVADSEVAVMLSYVPIGETTSAFIKGKLVGMTAESATGQERIYDFDIITNYDIDANDCITFTNGKMFANYDMLTKCKLTQSFDIIYLSSSLTTDFRPSELDSSSGNFLLDGAFKVVTHERLELNFGFALKNLWCRSRTLPNGVVYKKHQSNIPMLYDKDVYETDPVTGSIVRIDPVTGEVTYNKLHVAGDVVLDANGFTVYKYKAGDVMLDINGDPLVDQITSVDKELDVLFVDGRYFFTTDNSFVDYRSEIATVIKTWITDDLKESQNKLLEQTRLFFYPKTTLGKVKVYPNNDSEDILDAEQSLTVDLYVNNKVYQDPTIRTRLSDGVVKLIDNWIDDPVVNMTELHKQLVVFTSDSVISLSVKGLGGDKNYQMLTLTKDESRLCIKKKLYVQPDGTTIIKEDVVVNFINVEKINN